MTRLAGEKPTKDLELDSVWLLFISGCWVRGIGGSDYEAEDARQSQSPSPGGRCPSLSRGYRLDLGPPKGGGGEGSHGIFQGSLERRAGL